VSTREEPWKSAKLTSIMIAKGAHIATAQQVPTNAMNTVACKVVQYQNQLQAGLTYLNRCLDKERHEGQETEKQKGSSPNITQKEGHHRQTEGLALSGSFGSPLEDSVSEASYFCIFIDILLSALQPTVAICEVRK